MRIAGVIVAGGRSTRMGTEKALLTVAGRSVIAWVAAALVPQVERLMINANGEAGRFAATGLDVIDDRRPEVGTPLAGIHAGLCYARDGGYDAVLTVPGDCPFLPRDLAGRLQPGPAVAASGGQSHYLTGLWPVGLLASLEAALDDGLFRVKDWAALCGAAAVEWGISPHDPFFNLNRPDDLAEAQRIAQGISP